MADVLSDGTISWLGGMDTSRDPSDISEIQYAKGCNVIIPDSLGGIRVRFGLHCARLSFDSEETKELYRNHAVLAEGSFQADGESVHVILIHGYVLRFRRINSRGFQVEKVNPYDPNRDTTSTGWVIPVPGGCIVNNGFDYPLYVTKTTSRRTDPQKGEIGIGRMGVYVQFRLFYVDQAAKRVLASDFMQPLKNTREGTNIFGFACPDSEERITAITKQKSIMGNVEGGNLAFSSTKDIYSVDVRGTRTEWANLNSNVGKVSETVPGFSAASSYSFESFNTNIYFRSAQYGISDLKQSEYQFLNLDTVGPQSIEASYFLDNDTSFMLDRCYTKACNKRLYTTVTPERDEKGFVFWNGILSYSPSAIYSATQGSIPRRFESIFTGVRPWTIGVNQYAGKDEMLIHSFDRDGITRMYIMDEESDYDVDNFGTIKEIEGYIETRAFTLKNKFLLKKTEHRSYRLNRTERDLEIKLFSRPETQGEWVEFWNDKHLICRNKLKDNVFEPINHRPQTRPFVNMPQEKFDSVCYRGTSFIALQYRIEFKGPLNFDSILILGNAQKWDLNVTSKETECITLTYDFRKDYNYSIANG